MPSTVQWCRYVSSQTRCRIFFCLQICVGTALFTLSLCNAANASCEQKMSLYSLASHFVHKDSWPIVFGEVKHGSPYLWAGGAILQLLVSRLKLSIRKEIWSPAALCLPFPCIPTICVASFMLPPISAQRGNKLSPLSLWGVSSDRENRELVEKFNDPEKNREITGNFAKKEEDPGIFFQLYIFF